MLCITFLRDVTMLSEMREQMSVQKELLEAFQQLSTAGDAQELSRKTPKLFTSSAMIKLYGEVNTIAETDATVLLLGETGVGKDVIARPHPRPEPAQEQDLHQGGLRKHPRKPY